MKVAVDSSVLWAIFKGERAARDWVVLLAKTRGEFSLVVCDAVFAEVASLFDSEDELARQLNLLGVDFEPVTRRTAFLAGQIFRQYRQEGGPREHLLPDFLIGAHALIQARALAATDRGFMRRYFPRLKILEPN